MSNQVIQCEGFNFSSEEKAAIAAAARKDPNGGIVSRLRGWDASASPESTLALVNLAADWIESHRKEILHNREYLEWQRLNQEEQQTIREAIRREVDLNWGTPRNMAGPLQGILNRLSSDK